MNQRSDDVSTGIFMLSEPQSAITNLEYNNNGGSGDNNNEEEEEIIDENQLTTNSSDLRQLRKDVLEYATNNPSGFKLKYDVMKRASVSSREGSNIYEQSGDDYQRMMLHNEVVKPDDGELELLLSHNDTNWGWVIVMGSLMCMLVVDGICFTHGLHINWIKSYFALKSTSLAVLPGSLMSGLYLVVSPFDNILANVLTYRTVAMIGCVMASFCLCISAFISNYLLFVLTFGILTGMGFGLMYLPAIAIVAHWFNQYRAVAIGVALCGSGIGMTLLSFLLPYLIQEFTGRGSLIILASICIQSLVGVALFRPYELHQRLKQLKRDYQLWKLRNSEALADRKREKKEKKLQKAMKKEQKRREKIAEKKKIVITRGSIFTRIMEEKNRQRNVSTGSLDGMLITQMNQLVTASQVDMGGNLSMGTTSLQSLSAQQQQNQNNPVLPARSLDRVVEATLRAFKVSTTNQLSLSNRNSTTSNLQNSNGGGNSKLSNVPSKKSSANSINEMMVTNEILADNIPIELIKQYMERQKSNKEENDSLNQKNASFRVGSFVNSPSEEGPPTIITSTPPLLEPSTIITDDSSHKNASGSNVILRQRSNSNTSSNNYVVTLTPTSNLPSNTASGGGSFNQLSLPADVKETLRANLLQEIDRPGSRRDLYYSGSFHHMLATEQQSASRTPEHVTGGFIGNSINTGNNHTNLNINISNNIEDLSPCRHSCPIINSSKKHDLNSNNNEYLDNITNNSYKSSNNQSNGGCFDLWCGEFMDLNLYKNYVFQLLVFSSIFMMMGFGVPFFFLPNILRNYSSLWTSLAITSLGISNIVGRLLATLYIERSWAFEYTTANAVNLTIIFLFVASVSLIIIPLGIRIFHISLVLLLSFMYGFSISMVVSIRSMLVVELFGVINLTKSFTSLLIFQGLASIIGPYISGIIWDVWEDGVFLFGGLSYLLSTILVAIIRHIQVNKTSNYNNGNGYNLNSSPLNNNNYNNNSFNDSANYDYQYGKINQENRSVSASFLNRPFNEVEMKEYLEESECDIDDSYDPQFTQTTNLMPLNYTSKENASIPE